MEKIKTAISSASAKLRSMLCVKAVSPKTAVTVGLTLTPDQAKELAAYLLACAYAKNAKGDIYVTGKPDKSVTIIRKIDGPSH